MHAIQDQVISGGGIWNTAALTICHWYVLLSGAIVVATKGTPSIVIIIVSDTLPVTKAV